MKTAATRCPRSIAENQKITCKLLKILVADAVAFEPVSAPKFPANREINREFRQIRPLCKILKADTRATSKASSEIPYATEQGIIPAEQGILLQELGILPVKSEIITG